MEPGACGHIQNGLGSMLMQQLHEEIAFGFFACLPIDQAIPAVSKLLDVLLLVVVRFPHAFGGLAEPLSITGLR